MAGDKQVYMDTDGKLYAAESAKTANDVLYPLVDASLIDVIITDTPKTVAEIEAEQNIPRDRRR